MTLNKALIALAIGLTLAACSNKEQAADAAADANQAATDDDHICIHRHARRPSPAPRFPQAGHDVRG